MTPCPRCPGAEVAAGQEYCLECGLRLPGVSRLGAAADEPAVARAPARRRGSRRGRAAPPPRSGSTRDTATATTIVTATGGSELARVPTVTTSTLTDWPQRSGWTNVLVSIPKVDGRDEALARAEQARRRGLRQVGVLDSSRYASLHPGYWVVFAGVYTSEPEATSRLREAKGVQRGASH